MWSFRMLQGNLNKEKILTNTNDSIWEKIAIGLLLYSLLPRTCEFASQSTLFISTITGPSSSSPLLAILLIFDIFYLYYYYMNFLLWNFTYTLLFIRTKLWVALSKKYYRAPSQYVSAACWLSLWKTFGNPQNHPTYFDPPAIRHLKVGQRISS